MSATARFCGSCGVRLLAQMPPAQGGARRQVAVLFCDIVDSTPLSQQLDAEDLGELLLGFQQMATAVITGLGGTISGYAGDGLVAWFGWPTAHEDDTALAVQAGLDILAGLDRLSESIAGPGGVRLSARAGVHVGSVVVRTDRADTPAFGETMNIAARLQSAAAPNTLIVSEIAQRLIRSRFRTTGIGAPKLKGVDREIQVHRVDGPRDTDDAAGRPFDGPLVGRARDLAQLAALWETTALGRGGTAVIRGEPGVGKSRLLAAMRSALTGETHRWLEFRCAPVGVNSAFRPIAEMMRRALDIGHTDAPDEQRRRLDEQLTPTQSQLVARLLGLHVIDEMAPETFRRDLMETLQSWLVALARKQPIVIAGEDLHWSDPSTLALIRQLQERLAGAPVLLVLTVRAEATIVLGPHEEFALDRLAPDEARTLARHLAAAHGLANDVADRVAERSDGVPLFVEELVTAAGEDDDVTGLPTSLHSSLLSRLDRLGPARDVAQIASVLGRSFPESLLAAAVGTPAGNLAPAMRQLMAAGLIEHTDSIDGLRYQFRHALIRDAAYASLLKRRRTELHRTVASVLEEHFAERVSVEPEVIAHHLALGQEPLRAAQYFERAGRRAAQSAALAEAAAHYRRGIEVLVDVPTSDERDAREMWLGILLGNALMGLEGHGAESLRAVWERAIALGERVGDADELTAALNGLAVQETDNGNLDAAVALAERQIQLALRTGSRFARLRGHGSMGLALFYRGAGREALTHLEESLACYRPGDFHIVTFGVGFDQGIFARAARSWVLWWLGRPDAALAEIQDAVAEAEQLGSFLTLAMARHFLTMSHQLRREHEAALHHANVNATFSRELGFRYWEGAALVIAGHARTVLGEPSGLQDIQHGIERLSIASSQSGTLSGFATLAEAYHAIGDTPAALTILDGALTHSQTLGQPYWDAELLRLKADLSLSVSAQAAGEAEVLLRRALADATARGAGSPALRTATSLARLLTAGGRGAEAGEILAGALAEIHDGESTRDVQEARALLHDPPPVACKAREVS